MSASLVVGVVGSEGPSAPPIKLACARTALPCRLHRTRRANATTPLGARYVGRGTINANPFERRPRIGHARSVILHRSWIHGDLTPYILSRCGFGEHEILALDRWRQRLMPRLIDLRGYDLQCWCPLTSMWCHAVTLLQICNGSISYLERLAA